MSFAEDDVGGTTSSTPASAEVDALLLACCARPAGGTARCRHAPTRLGAATSISHAAASAASLTRPSPCPFFSVFETRPQVGVVLRTRARYAGELQLPALQVGRTPLAAPSALCAHTRRPNCDSGSPCFGGSGDDACEPGGEVLDSCTVRPLQSALDAVRRTCTTSTRIPAVRRLRRRRRTPCWSRPRLRGRAERAPAPPAAAPPSCAPPLPSSLPLDLPRPAAPRHHHRPPTSAAASGSS